jgi:hypothetical protein
MRMFCTRRTDLALVRATSLLRRRMGARRI